MEFFLFCSPLSGGTLFIFIEGRTSDWDKESIFKFRSLYSNVEIDSVGNSTGNSEFSSSDF